MSRPTFLEGVAVALATSVAGTGLYSVLTTVFAGGDVLRLLIAGISLGYVLYILHRSRARLGRVTAVGLWAVIVALVGHGLSVILDIILLGVLPLAIMEVFFIYPHVMHHIH